MNLGEKILATTKKILITLLMALLATLAMPLSVYAEQHVLNFFVAPMGSGLTSPANNWINVSSDTGALTAISVTPNDGYTFYKWHINWTDGLDDQEFYTPSATIGCSHANEAHAFLINNSSTGIVVQSDDETNGTVIGTRTWSWGTDGQYFTISATPKDPTQYEFDYWEKNGSKVSLGASAEVPMPKIDISNYDADTGQVSSSRDTYIAHFKSKGSDHGFRAVPGTEGGNITGQTYLAYTSWKGSSATVTANPDEGYDFVKWVAPDGSDYSTNKNISVPYPSPEPSEDAKKNDIVYTAMFKPHDSKGISVISRLNSETGDIGGGSVSPAYVEWSDSNKNQAISFTASPDKNMKFVKWVVPDNLAVKGSLLNPTLSVVMPGSKPTDSIEIIAVFAEDEKHEVYFDVLGESDGSYSSGLGGTVTPPMIEPKDGENTSVNLQATPWDGYEFEKWELEDSSTTSVVLPADLTKSAISITVKKQEDVTSDVHIRAYFKKATNKGYWTYGVEGGDTSPRYTKWQSGGDSFTITATPKSGYKFDHWEKYDRKTGTTNKLYSSDSTCSVPFDAQAPEDNIYFYAYFKKESGYGIYSYGIQGGDTSPRFTRWTESTKGSSVTLSATPYDGYVFDHWRYDNRETGERIENYSKLSTISVKMPLEEMKESRIYSAIFKPVGDFGIYTDVAGNVGGATSPKFTQWTEQNKGTSIAISASPASGYVFDHWRYINKETGETIENYSRVPTISVLMPKEINGSIYLYAVFKEENKFGIYALGIEGGEATPRFTRWTEQNKGSSITLTATPNVGYEFNHWRYYNKATNETIENYSFNQEISVKMPESEPEDNVYYFAVFEKPTNYGIYSYGIQGGDTSPRFTKWSEQNKGSSISLTATADDGYVFDHWRFYNAETQESIENYSSLSTISVKIPNDKMLNNRYYYAVFRKVDNLGIYSQGIEGGETSPRFTQWSESTRGQTVTLTATPDTDYEFDHWRYYNKETGITIENYSTGPSISVIMPSEMTDSRYYYAVFKKKEVKGIYSYGIEGGDTSPRFTEWTESTKGQSFQLQATPAEGYEFDHWRFYNQETDETIENYSTLPSISVVMPNTLNNNLYYFAVFRKETNFGIYSYGIQGGDTSPRFTKWSEQTKGSSVSLTATADDDYVFDHWRYYNAETEESIENYSSLATISVKMPDSRMTANHYYYAVFRKVGDMGIYSQGIEGGETNPRYVQWSEHTKGTSITLTATPSTGYVFDHWRYYNKETGTTIENYSTTNTISVIMPNEMTDSHYYYAIFKKETDFGIYSYGIEGGDTSPRFTEWTESTKGQSFQLQATPKEGYEFDHWRFYNAETDETIENYSTLQSISVKMPNETPTANRYYFAVFRKINEVGIYSFGVEGGETSPRYVQWTEQTKGTSITLTATPAEGYEFDHWRYFNKETGATIENYSTVPTISVKMPVQRPKDNIYYYAVFRTPDDIGIYSQGIEGGDTSPRFVKWSDQTKGTSITLTATPEKGYEFDHWRYLNKETGETIENYSNLASISVVMPLEKPTDSHYYYAVFKRPDEFGIYSYGVEGGDTSPRFTLWTEQSRDQSIQLQATPAEGYEFDHWRYFNEETNETIENYSTLPSISVKMPGTALKANIYYYAVFRKTSEIGIYSYGIEGGDTSPRYVKWSDQTKGTSITLTAKAEKGYSFDHWRYYNKETGEKIENYSKLDTISVKMPEQRIKESRYYYAVFKKNSEKAKNKEIHVIGEKTGITDEKFLDKWRTWTDPVLKYVRSTIEGLAKTRTDGDVSVYESNKPHGYDSSNAASELKADINSDPQMKHSQSLDNPIITDTSGFNVSEVSGLKTVYLNGSGAKSQTEANQLMIDKYGELYDCEIVLEGDIYFEDEKGDRISIEPSIIGNDATVVITGIDTVGTDIWMMIYIDSSGNEFTITPISDSESMLRFTLPDRSGGKITLLSVKYK